jgi:antitoxin HigA-1
MNSAQGASVSPVQRIITEARCDMSIPNTRERKVRPTHPGEMLREDFLPDYGLTVASLARALGVSRQTINEVLRERRAVSPEMALRLARLFGNSPEFWLNAQRAVDLWEANRAIKTKVERIKPLRVA